MYAVISAPSGDLTLYETAVNRDAISRAVGGYFDLVRLRQQPAMFGYVNADGLVMAPPLARNPIGAGVLVCLGATMSPYAGPVVITGWDPDGQPTELADLSHIGRTTVELAHAEVVNVRNGNIHSGAELKLERYMRWVEEWFGGSWSFPGADE